MYVVLEDIGKTLSIITIFKKLLNLKPMSALKFTIL